MNHAAIDPSGKVEALNAEDILPENFYELAPDDRTVEMACLFSRNNPLGFRETETLTAVLLAWEQGKICGFTAIELCELNECLPYDEVLEVYLAFIRARAAMTPDVRARAALEDGRAL